MKKINIFYLFIFYLIIFANISCQDDKKDVNYAKQTLALHIPIVDIQNIISEYTAQWVFDKDLYLGIHTILSLAFSNDDKKLAVGNMNEIKIFETSTKKSLTDLNTQDSVSALAYSKDDKYLAAGVGRNLKIWDGQTTKLLYDTQHPQNQEIYSLSFSNDAIFTTAGYDPQSIDVFNANNGNLKHTINFSEKIGKIAYFYNQKKLAYSSYSNLHIYDIETAKILKTFTDHSEYITALSFSNDGITLASGDCRGNIKIWNLNSYELQQEINNKDSCAIECLQYSNDNKFLAAASSKTINIYNAKTNKIIQTFNIDDNYNAARLAFSNNSKYLAVILNCFGWDSRKIRFYKYENILES